MEAVPDPLIEEEVPEVEVEAVPEQYETHVPPPQAPLSYAEITYYYTLNYFSNPWAFLILLYIVYRLFRISYPYVSEPLMEWYSQWQAEREARVEAARYKKNPDEFRDKMEAMETARLRMQERYNVDAEAEAIRQQEKEERKRLQDIQDWDDHQMGKGYKARAGERVDKEREALEQQARLKGKKGYTRPDNYSPLMGGGGGGGGFRPAPRRGGASGGG